MDIDIMIEYGKAIFRVSIPLGIIVGIVTFFRGLGNNAFETGDAIIRNAGGTVITCWIVALILYLFGKHRT